jgi:hypothetical protein
MKTLNAKTVEASEAGGEYFQVHFEGEIDGQRNYFLIQRAFEGYEDDEEPAPPYVESEDMTFCGFEEIRKAVFGRNRLYLQLNDDNLSELEILYDISDEDFDEIKDVFSAIFYGLPCYEVEKGF